VHEERLKEEMWTEIINAMERIYTDLANSQTELEKAEEELRRHRNHLEELVEEKNTEA
jgi:DNA repair exonuclease SbcCD ATPase subunit